MRGLSTKQWSGVQEHKNRRAVEESRVVVVSVLKREGERERERDRDSQCVCVYVCVSSSSRIFPILQSIFSSPCQDVPSAVFTNVSVYASMYLLLSVSVSVSSIEKIKHRTYSIKYTLYTMKMYRAVDCTMYIVHSTCLYSVSVSVHSYAGCFCQSSLLLLFLFFIPQLSTFLFPFSISLFLLLSYFWYYSCCSGRMQNVECRRIDQATSQPASQQTKLSKTYIFRSFLLFPLCRLLFFFLFLQISIFLFLKVFISFFFLSSFLVLLFSTVASLLLPKIKLNLKSRIY